MATEQERLKIKVQLLDETAFRRAMMRLSYEIVEKSQDLGSLVLVGIRTRGVHLAQILQENIYKNSGVKIPMYPLDTTEFRDDLPQADGDSKAIPSLPFDVSGKEILLVDDVLYTGRTVRAAIDALFTAGRPSKIRLAVLIDRGHRELPIRPDYVGKNVPTSHSEVIRVNLEQTDGRTNVEICEKNGG